jgi:phosphate:Na+ symporter
LDTALNVIAGLGLFIVGISLIGTHLGQIAGRRMRALVNRAMGGQRATTSLGLLLGAVMQSPNAVIFMLANLVQAGILDTRRAQPMIAAANIGAAAVVLVASFSLRHPSLLLLALVGLAFHLSLHESPRLRAFVWTALGLGLLFLGVHLIREAAGAFKESIWLQELAASGSTPLALNFLLGFVVTLAVQSSSVITIVAMSVAKVDVIGLDHGISAVLGACLASGFSAFLFGPPLRGRARQLLLYQLVLKVAGVAAMSLLLALELGLGIPLVLAAAQALSLADAQTLAMIYLLVHVLSDLVVHPLHRPLERWLHRKAPESEEEEIARPHFLNDESLAEAQTALLLLEREQAHLLQGLTRYVDDLREEARASSVTLPAHHKGSQRLLGECNDYLKTLSGRHPARELIDDYTLQRSRLELVGALLETLWKFHGEVARLKGAEALKGLVHAMLESIHLLLGQLAETSAGRDRDGIEALCLITQDRSEMMDEVRRRCMGLSEQISASTRQSLFDATMYFERLVWLIGRYARQLPMTPADTVSEA